MVQAAPHPPKRLSGLLQDGTPGTLSSLVAEVNKLRELDATLKSLLHEPLKSKVRIAAVRDRTLVIHADSPAWAARARYASRGIMKNFNKLYKGASIRSIRVRVSPGESRQRPSVRPRYLSPDAAECLRAGAAGIQNPAIKAALRRLAENTGE